MITTTSTVMTTADYYVLPGDSPAQRTRFIGPLAEKVISSGRRLYIQTESEQDAEALNQQLWDFRADAFVPHTLLGQRPASPVEIGWDDQMPEHAEVYLNLAGLLPPPALRFERILEVVIQQPDVLKATRANYKRLEEAGIQIKMHDMRRTR